MVLISQNDILIAWFTSSAMFLSIRKHFYTEGFHMSFTPLGIKAAHMSLETLLMNAQSLITPCHPLPQHSGTINFISPSLSK